MDHGNSKPPDEPSDPDALARLLELELMQKRASWQQGKQRLGVLRAVSFLFLFVVVAGALVAFWVFFSPSQVSEMKERSAVHDSTPSPTASPR